MKNWAKGLLIVGGAIAIWKLVSKANELKTFYKQLQISVKGGQPAIRFAGTPWNNPTLRLNLNVEFYNPTKAQLTFEKPSVTVLYNGNTLVNSTIPKAEKFTIEPQTVSRMQNITFDIPLTSLTVVNTLVDISRKLSTGIEVKDSDNLVTKLVAIFGTLGNNLDSVLPLFEISCLIYFAGQPLTITTKIA